MSTVKAVAAIITAFVLAVCLNTGVFAELPDLEEWNQCRKYTILPSGEQSNSAVDCIVLRAKQETDVNRLHFLFMISLKSFEDEVNAGIVLDFGDCGTVELMCDGTSDYDTDVFFAELDSVMTDKPSGMLTMEITVGIKPGVPDDLVLDFYIYDTEGIASNTYSVDLSDEISGNDGSNAEDEENQKTSKTKTTKLKTTKVKTTKVRKSKTTKVKTTKSKTSKNNQNDTDGSKNNIASDEFEDIETVNEKNKLITICAVAVIACAAGGCTVGIINSRKKNGRGDK